MRNSSGEAVIGRAFRLVSAFGDGVGELSLDELAEASGLARSTAHRLAGQLAAHGALERSKRGWRLGIRMFEIGQRVPQQQRLRDAALAYMEDLYELTHETVHLAVLDEREVVYVEILSGHRKVPSPSRRGGRMPAHCTGVGKALLAFSPDMGAAVLRAAEPLPRRTPQTITDVRALLSELREVRQTGLAFDREEAATGLTCVAAPIRSTRGIAHAAVSVSMPAGGRLTPAQVAPAVRLAGLALTRQLGPSLFSLAGPSESAATATRR
jgi:DNA-binding IclR family transcriptional regulator